MIGLFKIPAFSPFVALRYLATRRINILGVLGVAFAVWAMLVVDGVFTGFVHDIHSNVKSSAPPLLLTNLPRNQGYDVLRDVLEKDEDVVVTAPRLRHHAMLQPFREHRLARRRRSSSQLEFDHTKNGFAVLIGIDPLLEPKVVDIPAWLQRGPAEIMRHGGPESLTKVFEEPDLERRKFLLLPDKTEWQARQDVDLAVEPMWQDHRSSWPGLVMGWRRAFNTPWVREGAPFDVICVAFPSDDEDGAVLRTDSVRVAFAGWFGSGSRMFDEATALLPIETVRSLLGHDEFDPMSTPLVTDIAIRPRAGMTAAQMTALQRRLEQKVQPMLPENSSPCAVFDWREQNSVYLSAVAQEHVMMQFVLMIVMLVSAFVIYATMHMLVVQKVKDIGIMAAVGGAPGGIGSVFLIGGTVVGVVGALLGVAAGLLSAAWLNPINDWLYATFEIEMFPRHIFDLQGVPLHLETSWIITVAIGAMVLAIVVAIIPARKAARMNPVTALSFE